MSNDNPEPKESKNNAIIIWMVVLCCAVFIFLKFSMHSTISHGDAVYYRLMGAKYYNGVGVKKDLGTAANMFERAAQLGDTNSQYILGHMYEKGQGLDVDLVKAAGYYRAAAQKGHLKSQESLGRIYLEGPEELKNLRQAYIWLHIAVEQGNYKALTEKLQVIELLSEEERAEAREEAKKYMELYVAPFNQNIAIKGVEHIKKVTEKVKQ